MYFKIWCTKFWCFVWNILKVCVLYSCFVWRLGTVIWHIVGYITVIRSLAHCIMKSCCIPVYSEHVCWIPRLRKRHNGQAKIMSEAEWLCSWIHSTEWRTYHFPCLVDMPLWLRLNPTGTGHLTLVIFLIRERGKKLYRMLQNFPYNWQGFHKFCILQVVEMYSFPRWI